MQVPDDWRKERVEKRAAKGGNFACVHLRRGDYARGRGSRAPSIAGAADQVSKAMASRGLGVVFVATDANPQEWQDFERGLKNLKVVRFVPTKAELKKFGDGGVAIIDQVQNQSSIHARKLMTCTVRVVYRNEISHASKNPFFLPGCLSPCQIFHWNQRFHLYVQVPSLHKVTSA